MPTSSSGFVRGREGASVGLLIPSPCVIKHSKQASGSESSLLVHHLGNRELNSGSNLNCVVDGTVCGRPNRTIGTWARLFGVFTNDDFGLYTVTFGRASIATRIS
jgi:hypothetical protein